MPEYNEVRVIAEELKVLIGIQLSAYELDDDNKYTNFDKLTLPIVVTDVRSRGKKIMIEFGDFLMVIGLGMTGGFMYNKTKHTHVSLMFDVLDIYYNDVRKFGRIEVIEKNKYFPVGVDLYDAVKKENWSRILKSKLLKRIIRDILLDQTIISGIGNYLMTDILYHARIHPERIGHSINDTELERIRVSTIYVVDLSYLGGGLTIKDFKTPNQKKGVYENLVYGQKIDQHGYQVIRKKVKGRTIHYVPELQKK